MPISFSMIILSSQLVVAVAYGVPKFDIARSCKGARLCRNEPPLQGRVSAAGRNAHLSVFA